jgi:hypothetical protein
VSVFYQVWYQRPEKLTFNDSGITRETLMDTHVCLGWIDAASRDHVFAWLNEEERPHAHSRMLQRPDLIAAGVIAHFSMSVGDVLIDTKGDMHVCSAVGWGTLAP